MKTFVLVFALVVLGSSSFVSTHVAAGTDTKSKTVILRVTSSNPKEIVSFDASYLFGEKNSKLTHAELKTPFELKAEAKLVNGVFQKTAGNGSLQVTVSTADEKSEAQVMSGSSNNVVIITTHPELPEKSKKWQDRFVVQAYD